MIRLGKQLRFLMLAMACVTSGLFAQQNRLHYFVVDRSRSIADKDLTQSLKEHIENNVNTLGEEDEVRIIFFNERAGGHKIWEMMNWDAKLEFNRHLEKEMRPRGSTRLYDTVVEVFKEIQGANERYDTVRVLILSDGDDSKKGKARSWQDVHPHANSFKEDMSQSLVTLYTLGYTPEERPDETLIRTVFVDDLKQEKNLFVEAPVANFEPSPSVVRVGEPVKFIPLPSLGNITATEWDFGDTNGSQNALATHRYTQPGRYQVTMNVTGPGGEDQAVKTVEVTPGPPPLSAEMEWFPENPRVGDRVRFMAKVNRTDADIQWKILGAPFQNDSPEMSFTAAAEVPIQLFVSHNGEEITLKKTLQVRPLPPRADFTISPKKDVEVGQVMTFSAKLTGDALTHTWRIDGQHVLEGAEVSWTPATGGLVEVAHFVEGPGGTSTESDKFLVIAPEPPVATFSTQPAVAVAGQPVTLLADEGRPGARYTWAVGDEEYQGQELTFTPDDTGDLSIKLVVEFADLETERIQTLPVVEGLLVIEEITADPEQGTYPLDIQFGVKTKGGTVASYAWDFGDGASSTDASPVHTYTSAGDYDVRVRVSNSAGKETVSPFARQIEVGAPLPSWVWKAVLGSIIGIGVLIVAIVFRPRAVPPVKTRWEYQGQFGGDMLGGDKRDMSALEIPAWTPSRKLSLKNKRGTLWILRDGIEHTEIPNGKAVEIDGVRFTFSW